MHSQPLCEVADGGLCAAVGGDLRQWRKRVHGRYIDHHAVALPCHGLGKGLGREQDPEEIEVERLAQAGLFTLEEIDNAPYWYSSPRKIRLGLIFNF